MTRPLADLLNTRRPLILDGAMGTELHRRGINVELPLWSARAVIESPDVVRAIHRDYLQAGADIITTNTFRTTRRTFLRGGLPDRSEEYTRQAIALAEEARSAFTDRQILIAGSIAPLEDCYRSDLVPGDGELHKEHTTHAKRLAEGGVDFILVETMGTTREAFAACAAAVQTGKEAVVSFLCTGNGNLYSGDSLAEAIQTILPLRPAGLSLNCISPRVIDNALSQILKSTSLPVAVYVNVGEAGGERSESFRMDVGPEEYATFAADWIARGVAIVGGCCGTTPEYVRHLAAKVGRMVSLEWQNDKREE